MHVLVTLDFSDATAIVMEEVSGRTWPVGAVFTVLTVVDPRGLREVANLTEHTTEHAQKLVEKATADLRERGLDAKARVFSGNPKAAIVEEARKSAADLVVVGSSGKKGVARFLLGGVAKAVVRHAPCSVAVVRATTRDRTEGSGLRILLATDGSPSSLDAAKAVAARSWPAGTEVRVLNVLEMAVPLLETPYFDQSAMEAYRAAAMKNSQDAIAAAEEILTAAGLATSETLSVLLESPKETILNETTEWGADLIVVGSHGHSAISAFLLGSVSEAVAIHAPCSVLVVRPLGR
ncbi:MAG: universal stress protein [bacterium]